MARLPQPGGDKGTWGEVLNEYLGVEHNSDGTLKSGGTLASYAPLANPTFTGSVTVPTPTSANQAVTKAYADGLVSSGVADATTSSKGKIQLAGDLAGTADSPQIAANAIVDANVNSSAAIAQSKIANLTSDLASKAPLASPTFTGTVTVPEPVNATDATTKQYVNSQLGAPELVAGAGIDISAPVTGISTISVNESEFTSSLQKSGGTMTGNLTVDPSGNGVVTVGAGSVLAYPTDVPTGYYAGLGNAFGTPGLGITTANGSAFMSSSATGRFTILSAATPVDANDVTTKSYVDSSGTHVLDSSATPSTVTSNGDLYSYSVASGKLQTGDVIELTLAGTFNNDSGSAIDLGFRLYIADTLVMTDTMTSVAANADRRKWRAAIEIVIGSSLSTQSSSGIFHLSNGSTAGWAVTGTTSVGSATSSIDQSGTHTIRAYTTFSTTGAQIDMVLNSAVVKLHRA